MVMHMLRGKSVDHLKSSDCRAVEQQCQDHTEAAGNSSQRSLCPSASELDYYKDIALDRSEWHGARFPGDDPPYPPRPSLERVSLCSSTPSTSSGSPTTSGETHGPSSPRVSVQSPQAFSAPPQEAVPNHHLSASETIAALTDEKLLSMDLQSLNTLLRRLNVPKEEQKRLKKRRRLLKNRCYATVFRCKRRNDQDSMKNDIRHFNLAKREAMDRLEEVQKDVKHLTQVEHEVDDRIIQLVKAHPELKDDANMFLMQCYAGNWPIFMRKLAKPFGNTAHYYDDIAGRSCQRIMCPSASKLDCYRVIALDRLEWHGLQVPGDDPPYPLRPSLKRDALCSSTPSTSSGSVAVRLSQRVPNHKLTVSKTLSVLDDDKLLSMDLPGLNTLLKRLKVPKDEQKRLKKRRRQLKNRCYASVFRCKLRIDEDSMTNDIRLFNLAKRETMDTLKEVEEDVKHLIQVEHEVDDQIIQLVKAHPKLKDDANTLIMECYAVCGGDKDIDQELSKDYLFRSLERLE
eukprot:maker-scaffold368_size193847-snap-gene-0.32 protein:Tk09998 transcript:maker-scaffold368_size193847-snap-gene-0.32-mRNA-1 annotation:"neural retina-specific leucine zipper protein"